jgi:hypothetical protein
MIMIERWRKVAIAVLLVLMAVPAAFGNGYDVSSTGARLCGDKIVAIYRESSSKEKLILFDIMAGTLKLIDQRTSAEEPAIHICDVSNDYVAYYKGTQYIYAYDLNLDKIIQVASDAQWAPSDVRVDQNYIIYSNTKGELVLCYLIPGWAWVFPIRPNAGNSHRAINGNAIAYEDRAPGTGLAASRLTIYNGTGWYTIANPPLPYSYYSLEIEKGFALWVENLYGLGNNKIKVLNVETAGFTTPDIFTINPPNEHIWSADIFVEHLDEINIVYCAELTTGSKDCEIRLWSNWWNGGGEFLIEGGIRIKAEPKIHGEYVIWHERMGPSTWDPWELMVRNINSGSTMTVPIP